MKRRKDVKKRREIVGIVVILVIITGTVLILNNVKKPANKSEKIVYQVYQQECGKDEGYFEDISKAVYGKINSAWIREYKRMSLHCDTNDIRNLTEREFDDLNIGCECKEREWKKCQEGWEFKNGFCWKDTKFTNPLKACSFYQCDENHFVEVYWPEKPVQKAKIEVMYGNEK